MEKLFIMFFFHFFSINLKRVVGEEKGCFTRGGQCLICNPYKMNKEMLHLLFYISNIMLTFYKNIFSFFLIRFL